MVLSTKMASGRTDINMQRLGEKLQEQHIKKAELLFNKAEKVNGERVYTPQILIDRLTKLGVDMDYVKKSSPVMYDFISSALPKKQVVEKKEAPPEPTESAPKTEEKQTFKKKDKPTKIED